MKKKIKDLTLEELHKKCGKTNCSKCLVCVLAPTGYIRDKRFEDCEVEVDDEKVI